MVIWKEVWSVTRGREIKEDDPIVEVGGDAPKAI